MSNILTDKSVRFVVTDVKHKCSECIFSTGGCVIGHSDIICEVIAKKLGVFATYAVVTGTPEKEYYGC